MKWCRFLLTAATLLSCVVAGDANAAPSTPCTYVAPSTTQQITGPDSVCKQVTNNSATNNLCVMAATTAQWQSFYNNPNGATVAACPPSCSGASVGGYCWYLSAQGASCDTACAAHGGYNAATLTYAGSGAALRNAPLCLMPSRPQVLVVRNQLHRHQWKGCSVTFSPIIRWWTNTPVTTN